MPRSLAALAATSTVFAALMLAPPAQATPYVSHVEWAKWGDLSSLRVYPTTAGRSGSGIGHRSTGEAAWAEVLSLAPDAAIAGMREQFLCHWAFAELLEPGKVSWNLEPWRPVVTDAEMYEANCNPGGSEEPF
ncbi:hypothetical protein BVC93_05740 [Mycobacterium sp. MS1601]|uniref:DUF2599 domain-containing protein n=1 Tax=Mycobacterium sp. MS1601 TaxID=1936029 RepID=UPI0009794EAF|nr:hypothetical protein BVC93_05740 [Mycobacterium sp. MS1601]